MCRCLFLITVFLCNIFFTIAQTLQYPYPVKYFTPYIEEQQYKMAFMDVKPEKPNGEVVILFHGKNFNGLYWKEVIASLVDAGYRVIAPDQVGWGKSSKPNIKYTFEMLANNNRLLLDSLQILKVNVIGHSMGGMLAVRFALRYPQTVSKLILENPLGLEDYKEFVPYTTMENQYKKELNATYASYKKYQKSYYPVWKPEYELYVKAQAEPLKQKDFSAVAWVNALTYQMIYEQPVLYEFDSITAPTLFIVGQLDRTFIGKDLIKAEQQKLHGNLPALARKAKAMIKNSLLIQLPNVGHIPHIQGPALFNKHILSFLKNGLNVITLNNAVLR
jgi:pimeloyl-ACP methyl ester carboxylesterase